MQCVDSEGNRIVAEIADQYLEPATARQVRDLLAIENATTLAQVSTWVDDIRPQRRETARWHFVNIPIHPPAGTPAAYDAARDCPGNDCVVAAIERFMAVLRDKATPSRERLEALKFVVHFVADVHQPLHASDDGDKGGNAIHVTFMGRSTNLHAVWDWRILAPAVAGDEHAYTLQLARSITAAQAEQWRRGSPPDWASESYGIAQRRIYGEWPHAPGALPTDYEANACRLVRGELLLVEFTDQAPLLGIGKQGASKHGKQLVDVGANPGTPPAGDIGVAGAEGTNKLSTSRYSQKVSGHPDADPISPLSSLKVCLRSHRCPHVYRSCVSVSSDVRA